MSDLHANCRLWIYADSRPGVFGDGKWRLLKEIARQGSLRKAAAVLGISYRKAWSDLRKAESCLQAKLIEKTRGGLGGGQTTLTNEGERLVRRYERFQEQVRSSVEGAFASFLEGVRA